MVLGAGEAAQQQCEQRDGHGDADDHLLPGLELQDPSLWLPLVGSVKDQPNKAAYEE